MDNVSEDEEFPSLEEIFRYDPQGAPPVIDLTGDSFNEDVNLPFYTLRTASACHSSKAGAQESGKVAIPPTPACLSTPRKSPFKNRPPWAIRRPSPVIQPLPAVGEVLTITAAASPSPEIADSNHVSPVNNGACRGPVDFVFDVFAKDDDGPLTNQEYPRAGKRQARTLSSSASNADAQAFVAVAVPGVESGSEWQPTQIVGERQTSTGVQYQVRGQVTMWMRKASVKPKLVKRYHAERRAQHRAQPRAGTRCSSRLQGRGRGAK